MGFKFSITDPQKEEKEGEEVEEDAKGEAEAQRKASVEDEQQQKDNRHYEERVRPGQPMVIPSSVSLSLSKFRYKGPFIMYGGFYQWCFFFLSVCFRVT